MKNSILTVLGIVILITLANLASALTIDSVSMNPDEIAPGETSDISIGIENDGKEDIEDVSVVLDLADVPFAPYDSSSEYSIDEIRDGKVKYAEFKIIALNDAESGIYKIPLEITYREKDSDEITTKSSLIGITVNSEPILGVSLEDGLLLKGKKNEVSIKIVNKGLSKVRFLEVEIMDSNYFNILSPKNVYVGDIDSDDFDSIDYEIFFKGNTPDRINFPLTITYKDATNKVYTEDFNLGLSVYSTERAIELGLLKKSNTATLFGILITFFVLYFVYRKIKKRRKLKSSK